jgi:hypothetical protein
MPVRSPKVLVRRADGHESDATMQRMGSDPPMRSGSLRPCVGGGVAYGSRTHNLRIHIPMLCLLS